MSADDAVALPLPVVLALARAWDASLTVERRGLLALADLPTLLWARPWSSFDGYERQQLCAAMQRVRALADRIANEVDRTRVGARRGA